MADAERPDETMHGGQLAAALVDWLETSALGVRRLARDYDLMRQQAEAAEARLVRAREALRVVRSSLDAAGCSVHGMSALETALGRP